MRQNCCRLGGDIQDLLPSRLWVGRKHLSSCCQLSLVSSRWYNWDWEPKEFTLLSFGPCARKLGWEGPIGHFFVASPLLAGLKNTTKRLFYGAAFVDAFARGILVGLLDKLR